MLCRMTKFAALTLMASAQVACSGGKGSGSQAQIIPIKGDPMTFIRGTQRDSRSGWEIAKINTGQDYAVTLRVYRTVEQENPRDFGEVMKEQAPATTQPAQESIDLAKMKWKSLEGDKKESEQDHGVWRITSGQTAFPELTFREQAGRLHLINLSFTGFPNAILEHVKVEHYSQKADGKAHSVLMSFHERVSPRQVYKYLYDVSLYPIDNKPLLNQWVDSAYNYMFGPGVAVRWNQPPKLINCEIGDVAYSEIIEETASDWTTHLPVEFQTPPQRMAQGCPPFSDLNSQTIFLVRGWTEIVRPDIVTLAWVSKVANLETSEFIDSDMMIMENEFTKVSMTKARLSEKGSSSNLTLRHQFETTMRHEFGHTFGLHHEFEKRSVMGYNHQLTELQTHDVEALQTLYGPVQLHTAQDAPTQATP